MEEVDEEAAESPRQHDGEEVDGPHLENMEENV